MKDQGKAPAVALEALKAPKNAAVDSEERRALAVEEMHHLLKATAAGPVRSGLTGAERALFYRFAFETGMRPGQIRNLTVADFDLTADPPTVTTQARYVKRRRMQTQIFRPALAVVLRDLFKSKLPTAPAIRMPSKHHMAEMLRKDLADARAIWISAAPDDKEREHRQRSDFLADTDHEGRRAVCYSTRHGHGTALADAGVPEKDIAASMHHASRKTTARYLHSDRKARRSAIDAMPDLAYTSGTESAAATGTNGPEPTPGETPACTDACTTGRSRVESGGQNDDPDDEPPRLTKPGKLREIGDSRDSLNTGLLAELADAMDSKSISQKECGFKSHRGHSS